VATSHPTQRRGAVWHSSQGRGVAEWDLLTPGPYPSSPPERSLSTTSLARCPVVVTAEKLSSGMKCREGVRIWRDPGPVLSGGGESDSKCS